jgi:hypothetical protein
MVPAVAHVLLIHGGFVGGSGWQGVYELLKKNGFNVSVVQNPTTSLADDVAATKRMLAMQEGLSILVGHYRKGSKQRRPGGQVVTVRVRARDEPQGPIGFVTA